MLYLDGWGRLAPLGGVDMAKDIRSEEIESYGVAGNKGRRFKAAEDAIIQEAKEILRKRLEKKVAPASARGLSSPEAVVDFIRLNIVDEREHLFIMCLDAKNKMIGYETLFHGTISSCEVSDREILKTVLAFNAARVILGHNHPSGGVVPSRADIVFTERIARLLKLIQVPVLDHIIVGPDDDYAFAANGQMDF